MSWEDYERAHVRIRFPDREVLVRPDALGSVRGRFPDPLGRTIHVITADNPGGRVSPAPANRAAKKRLMEELAGLELRPAVGGHAAWVHTEDSVAVVGLTDEEACEIGARHGQDAVFAWRPTAWLVLSCDGPASSTFGWVTESALRGKAGTRAPD